MKIKWITILLLILFFGYNSGWSQAKELNNSQTIALAPSITPVAEAFQLPQPEKEKPSAPLVYAHFFGGMGFSYLSSSDINDVIKSLTGDEFGIGIGLPTWSYGIRGGFKHLLQVEYNMGDAAHNFNNNSIIPDIPSETIEMDYDSKDLQVKVNPFFWRCKTNENGITRAFFIVLGTGDVEWKDKNNEGFEGSSTIYGVEWAGISKNISFGFSFKKYDIEFDKTILFNFPFEVKTKASDWIFEMKVGIGLGL